MSGPLAKKAGNAFIWKGIQLASRRGISIIRLLVLARLLLAEDFGLFSIGLVVVETILSLTDIGIIPALVQREEIEPNQEHTAWTTNLIRGLLISFLAILGAPLIAQLFAEPAATPIIRLLALRPLIDGFASIGIANLTRDLKFQQLTFIFVPAIVIETIISIAFAPTLGVWALVWGILVAAIVCVVLSYVFAPYRPRIKFSWPLLQPLIQFGRWIFMTKLVAVSGSTLLQVVISRQLGTESLGIYYLAAKLAFLPNDVAGEVVGAVAFSVYSRLQYNLDRTRRAFQSILMGIYMLVLPVYVLLIVLIPLVVEFVLGDKWGDTIPIVRILAIASSFGLFGETAVPIFQGLGRPNIVVVLEIVQSGMIIITVWTLASLFDVVGAASAWAPALISSQIVAAIFLVRILPDALKGMGRTIVPIVLISLLGGGIAYIISSQFPSLVGLILAAGIAGTIMIILIWQMEARLKLGISQNIVRGFPQVAELLNISSEKNS